MTTDIYVKLEHIKMKKEKQVVMIVAKEHIKIKSELGDKVLERLSCI